MFISLHKRYTKTIFRYFFKPSDDRNGDVGMCGNIRNSCGLACSNSDIIFCRIRKMNFLRFGSNIDNVLLAICKRSVDVLMVVFINKVKRTLYEPKK